MTANSKEYIYATSEELIKELENPSTSKYSTDGGLVIFDGVCNICNKGVRWIDNNNSAQNVQLGWMQDPTIMRGLLRHYDISDESILEKFAFIEKRSKISGVNDNNSKYNSNVYRGSDAACHVAKYMDFPHNLSYYFIYIPFPIREYAYDKLAKNRYKWYGKTQYCQMPGKSLLRRMVHPIKPKL